MSDNNIKIDTIGDDLAGRYLTFYMDDKSYGVELMHVLEIISIQVITTIPRTPAYVKGIINLRGRIVPVIDVRTKFAMPQREYDERTCIIVLNMAEMYVGLIVDMVSEVITLDNNTLSSLPELNNTVATSYLSSVAKVGEKLVLNLDCEKFLQDDLSHF